MQSILSTCLLSFTLKTLQKQFSMLSGEDIPIREKKRGKICLSVTQAWFLPYSFGTIDSPHWMTSCLAVVQSYDGGGEKKLWPLWFLYSQLLQSSCNHVIKFQTLHNYWVFKTIAVSCGHHHICVLHSRVNGEVKSIVKSQVAVMQCLT